MKTFQGFQAESTIWEHKRFTIKKFQIKKENLRQQILTCSSL